MSIFLRALHFWSNIHWSRDETVCPSKCVIWNIPSYFCFCLVMKSSIELPNASDNMESLHSSFASRSHCIRWVIFHGGELILRHRQLVLGWLLTVWHCDATTYHAAGEAVFRWDEWEDREPRGMDELSERFTNSLTHTMSVTVGISEGASCLSKQKYWSPWLPLMLNFQPSLPSLPRAANMTMRDWSCFTSIRGWGFSTHCSAVSASTCC